MLAGLDNPTHLLILVAAAAVLLGYKRLPDAAHSVGRALHLFRSEVRDLTADDPEDETATHQITSPITPEASE